MRRPRRPTLLAVLFDWDGTIVDSAEASYRCYVRLFAHFGIRFERTHFERTYSPDWYKTYRALGLPEALWPEADARWIEDFRGERAALIPGAREALGRLRHAGLALGLVTSAERRRVAAELSDAQLAALFRTLVCAGDAAKRKPHPESLLLGLDRLGVSPGDAAYVGDSPEDVEMARAAGVYSVGIPGGFPNREALRASGAELMVTDLAQAVDVLLALGRGSD